MIPLALAGGLLGLIASLALRRNTTRARSWEGNDGLIDERFVYLSLPGFSLLLLGFGALGLLLPIAGSPLGMVGAVIAGVAALTGVGFSAWGLFAPSVPTWALPRWKRPKQ